MVLLSCENETLFESEIYSTFKRLLKIKVLYDRINDKFICILIKIYIKIFFMRINFLRHEYSRKLSLILTLYFVLKLISKI